MSSFDTVCEVRGRILADHGLIRHLLRSLLTTAEAALTDEKRRQDVRAALEELGGVFERHLQFEEERLRPLLLDADAWGPVRAASMETDHVGQRALLVGLTEDAGDGVRDVKALVEEIAWFVESIGRDITEEEKALLSAEALGEESISVDQIDG